MKINDVSVYMEVIRSVDSMDIPTETKLLHVGEHIREMEEAVGLPEDLGLCLDLMRGYRARLLLRLNPKAIPSKVQESMDVVRDLKSNNLITDEDRLVILDLSRQEPKHPMTQEDILAGEVISNYRDELIESLGMLKFKPQ